MKDLFAKCGYNCGGCAALRKTQKQNKTGSAEAMAGRNIIISE